MGHLHRRRREVLLRWRHEQSDQPVQARRWCGVYAQPTGERSLVEDHHQPGLLQAEGGKEGGKEEIDLVRTQVTDRLAACSANHLLAFQIPVCIYAFSPLVLKFGIEPNETLSLEKCEMFNDQIEIN